jgi:hypothetical protein
VQNPATPSPTRSSTSLAVVKWMWKAVDAGPVVGKSCRVAGKMSRVTGRVWARGSLLQRFQHRAEAGDALSDRGIVGEHLGGPLEAVNDRGMITPTERGADLDEL